MTVKLALSVEDLTKQFGQTLAVDELSFEVAPGRITGFLGPNGAGKTTCLRALLGLVIPTSGRALVQGKPYPRLKNPSQVVGAHLDSNSFQPGRSGYDHLLVAATESGVGKDRISGLLELVGLDLDADRKVGQYSLGMRQRLGLASALLGDPEILILDEPANGLDPEGLRWLRSFLSSFVEGGRTVFLSSHLLSEIQMIAQDVVIIDRGKLIASGDLTQLEARYQSKVLVASPDMDALSKALDAANLSAEPAQGMLAVASDALTVGKVALDARLPLSHLSEQSSGLEELYMSLVEKP